MNECWWHPGEKAVSTLRHRSRVRPLCEGCEGQIVAILHALDAQALDDLLDQSLEEIRDFTSERIAP